MLSKEEALDFLKAEFTSRSIDEISENSMLVIADILNIEDIFEGDYDE